MTEEKTKTSSEEISKDDNSEGASETSEGTEEKSSSSPTKPSGGNEDRTEKLESEVKEIQSKYSASSKEGKRLKKLLDENKESLEEKEEYISALEETIDDLEGDKSSSDEDKSSKSEKQEEKTEEKKEPESPKLGKLPPHLTKEGQARALKELMSKEKQEEAEADKQYKAALKEHPQLKNSGYKKLVSAKMKSTGNSIEDACQAVDADLKSMDEGSENEEEPFVEGGSGKSSPQSEKSPEDEIRESLRPSKAQREGLPGLF